MVELEADVDKGGSGAESASIQGAASSPEILRREFLKRFGAYAAGSAVGLYVLMSPGTSAIAGSDGIPADSPAQEPDRQQPFQYREYK